MKKISVIILAALTAFALCACAESTAKTAEGTVYDTGKFSVTIPEGMFAKPKNKTVDNEETADPLQLHIAATDDENYFEEPYVIVCCHDSSDPPEDASGFYENVEEISPFTVDGTEWTGFAGESSGYPITCITGSRDGIYFSVILMAPNESNKMTVKDEKVRDILGSIAITAK